MSELLIKLGKEQFEKKEARKEEFAHDEEANALLADFDNTPHAYVLACLMNRTVVAKRAWIIPHKIREKFRSFSMEALKKRSLAEWKTLFKEEKLHRFHPQMAEIFFLAVRDIDAKYDGDASKIWSNNPSSKDVVRRFREFRGAAQKISTMAANILVRQFEIPMSDYKDIDISVDVHIERVMLRMGLVRADGKKRCSEKAIINKARELSPEFPGVFDYACWKIGREFCHSETPDCPNCPVRTDCATGKKSV
ncbi:MAG: iron-sulfur cluster loop [Gammaproteobacteria bacterium]|nr:iron-sulfur cluster loop [Gammaproteobacteria bacterium]MDA8015658.1 iron-sulfur cluster loop [Gammaproteobacteria bacterium]